MSSYRFLTIIAIHCLASFAFVQGTEEEAYFAKAALSGTNRRLLQDGSGCGCGGSYDPVCGDDGRTHSNRGCATCAGATPVCPGECPCSPSPRPCICTREYNPVCGVDGRTYANRCVAFCTGVYIFYPGECRH